MTHGAKSAAMSTGSIANVVKPGRPRDHHIGNLPTSSLAAKGYLHLASVPRVNSTLWVCDFLPSS